MLLKAYSKIKFSLRPVFRFSTSEKRINVFLSDGNNIYFNLATEEYLYKHSELIYPTLFLWRNDKTVVIGRHQNPWKECYVQAMKEDGVLLSRRRSGGGAVYQDLGNCCFSFIIPVPKEDLPLNYKEKNNHILVSALKGLDINAEIKGRNDICVNDKKISGSAYQIDLGRTDGSGRKLLHHGTMLVNLDTTSVTKYLHPNKKKLISKGIDSVKARIDNLINIKPDLTSFKLNSAIIEEFKKYYPDHECVIKDLNYDDLKQIPKINEIYSEISSWEWLFHKTPQFTNNIETRFDWGVFDLFVKVVDGKIIDGKVFSDCLFPEYIDTINDYIQKFQIAYDEKGIEDLRNALNEKFKENQTYLAYTKDLEAWLKSVI